MTMTTSDGQPKHSPRARAWRLGLWAMALTMGTAACNAGPEAAMRRADALIAQGDVDRAHALLRTVAQRLEAQGSSASQDVDLEMTVLGRLAELNVVARHNVPEALGDLGRVVRLSPASDAAVAAQCRMADLFVAKTHEPERAVAALRAAAQTMGSRVQGAHIRSNLWATLMAMGNFRAAHEEALGVVERWPQSREASLARLTMGRADYMEGRFAKGAATLEALMDDSQDPLTQALAQVEAGNCYLEMGELPRALTFFYAALKSHPNAAMVQDKIVRVRERLYHMAPRDSILNASRPSRHIAAWQPRPTPQELGIGGPVLQTPAPLGVRP
jgi:tetratricopeptide (TPR) repeat protein